MQYYIKNMVCDRCILVVQQELEKTHIDARKVTLGEIETAAPIEDGKLQQLKKSLFALGFEMLDDARQQMIEKIKTIIREALFNNEEKSIHNFSDIISQSLHKDYSYISNLFSEVEGITIEKYIIQLKVEKAKELIIYDELSLTEIAYRLGYSSVAHLSNQFKKVTGLTPSYFKKLGDRKRKPLDKV